MRVSLLITSAVALGLFWLASRSSADDHGAAEERARALAGRAAFGLDALFRPWLPTGGDAYELDDVARFVEARGPLPCPSEAIVAYRGTSLRYARTAYVHRAFVARLAKLEEVIAAEATAIYGRPPRRIVHRGAYNCRRARGRPERLSEHALGNALDVRPDVIRGIVGPPARRHHDHLHLDVAPWRYGWYAHDDDAS